MRKIIAVGYCKGELLPPYGFNNDAAFLIRRNIEHDAVRILEYIKGKNPITAESSIYYHNYKKHLNTIPEKTEVVGSWLEMCVLKTADFLLRAGSEVLLNPEHLVSYQRTNYKQKRDFLDVLLEPHLKRTIKTTPEGILFSQNLIFDRIK